VPSYRYIDSNRNGRETSFIVRDTGQQDGSGGRSSSSSSSSNYALTQQPNNNNNNKGAVLNKDVRACAVEV
jgi:hypothetical protein